MSASANLETAQAAANDDGLPVSMELHHAVTMHYHREFHLLQSRRFADWLKETVAEDIHYWMPVLELRYAGDKPYEPTPQDAAIYSDTYAELKARVDQLATGLIWAEDPPTRIRYFMSNLEVFHADKKNEFHTRCNVMVVRHRRQDERYIHVFERRDVLRRDADGRFRVARRKFILDARVIDDKNLYFFS